MVGVDRKLELKVRQVLERALHHQAEGCGPRMRLRAAVAAEQIGEARMPDRVGAPCQRKRFGVGRRHHHEATETELG